VPVSRHSDHRELGAVQFRITTESETYIFDLKDRLPERAYDLAWANTYGLQPANDLESRANVRMR